jgi:hypothetical protein
MIDREMLKRRIEFLESYPLPTRPTKESVAEFACQRGISKSEAWHILRVQYAKERVSDAIWISSIKQQLLRK